MHILDIDQAEDSSWDKREGELIKKYKPVIEELIKPDSFRKRNCNKQGEKHALTCVGLKRSSRAIY